MAPRDDDKAMDGLLRRSLLRGSSAGDCPGPEILAAYQEGLLEGEEMARHELHFAGCARCRQQLAAIARAGAEVEIPAYAVEMAAMQASPAIAAADSGLRQKLARKRPGKRIWFLDWRFLAPVAAVLAISAVLYTQLYRRPEKLAGFNNQIALSRPDSAPSPLVTGSLPAAASPSAGASTGTARAVSSVPAGATEEKESLLAKKSSADQRGPSREQMERRQALAQPLDQERISNSLQKDPSRTAADTQAEVDRLYAGGAAAGARSQRVAPAPAAAPPPGSRDQKPDELIGALSNSAAAETLPVPPQPSPKSAMSIQTAPAKAKTEVPVAGRAAMDTARFSAGEKLIKSPGDAAIYRIAEAGFIERSTDRGATWQGQQLDPNAEILAGVAPTAKICWLVGRDAAIYLTKDGTGWQRIVPPAQADFVEIAAADASSATVTARDGRKFSTRDGGKSWTLLK